MKVQLTIGVSATKYVNVYFCHVMSIEIEYDSIFVKMLLRD